MKQRYLRRSLLGGAGAAALLPILDAFCNSSGTAFADETPLPTCFGLFTWGNGVRPDAWVPAATGQGDAWALSRTLAPLSALKHQLCVVSGTNIALTDFQHPQGASNIYSGTNYLPLDTSQYSQATPNGPTLDQVAAQAIGSASPYRSLELALYPEVEKNEGIVSQCVSHNGPNSPNFPSFDPGAVFDRLFGTQAPPGSPAPSETDPRLKYQTSVLDVVASDVQRLQQRVGAADRERLQQHFDTIRDLERTLGSLNTPVMADPALCSAPTRPSATAGDFLAIHQAMSKVLSLALACGMTRVFSYQLAGTRDFHSWDAAGVPGNYHSITHNTDNASFEKIVSVNTYEMQHLATLLTTLEQTKLGAGTLLDRCAVLATSEVATGHDHKGIDWPILIAGSAGGLLRTDQHVRVSGRHTLSIHLTLLQALGVPATSYGQGDHLRVTEPLSEIRT